MICMTGQRLCYVVRQGRMIGAALADEEGGAAVGPLVGNGKDAVRIVLMTGFESFNVDLYKKVIN